MGLGVGRQVGRQVGRRVGRQVGRQGGSPGRSPLQVTGDPPGQTEKAQFISPPHPSHPGTRISRSGKTPRSDFLGPSHSFTYMRPIQRNDDVIGPIRRNDDVVIPILIDL